MQYNCQSDGDIGSCDG